MSEPYDLIAAHLDGAATREESSELEAWINQSSANARRFVREAIVHSHLRDLFVAEQVLAEAEATLGGPAVSSGDGIAVPFELEKRTTPPADANLSGETAPRVRVRISALLRSRWSIAAALILTVIMVAMFRRSGGAHTDLAAAIDARWEGRADFTRIGGTLPAGELSLLRGFAQFTLSQGISVVVEAPARFEVESDRLVHLRSGRLTAMVPHGVQGFTVQTPSTRVVDLGTEFGVEVRGNGSVLVQVFQGAVEANALHASDPAHATLRLTEGQAAETSPEGTAITSATVARQHFARSLAEHLTSLDLVDLVAGGDGTTHGRQRAIDVRTGESGALPQTADYVGDHRYHRVPLLPVVDGCFVPDGTAGPMQVDSAGDAYAFPATSNHSGQLIWAGGPIPPPPDGNWGMKSTVAGVDYSQPGHGLIAMHPNKGLTFNLDALRRLHPGSRLDRFQCVVAHTSAELAIRRASVLVLVDGKIRFERLAFSSKEAPFAADVPLHRDDRFLTLATIEAGDGIGVNWVLIGDPLISLESR